jgi:hypothetical protein
MEFSIMIINIKAYFVTLSINGVKWLKYKSWLHMHDT